MSKKTFKPTLIPHRTKSGEPMSYYILSEDGTQKTKVTRAECLARTDEPGIELAVNIASFMLRYIPATGAARLNAATAIAGKW